MQSVAAHLCSCPIRAVFSWQPSEHASAKGQRRGAALFYLKAWSLLSWGRVAKHKLHLSCPPTEGSVFKASVGHIAPWRASSLERGHDDDPERFPDKLMKLATHDAQLSEPAKCHVTSKHAHQDEGLSAHLPETMMNENSRGQKDMQDPGKNSMGTDAVDGAEMAETLPFGFEHSLQAVPKFGPVEFEGDEGCEILPVMPLSSVKFPTEDVPLQLFEPRYRAMIKLVNQTPGKRFGIVLGDRLNATMESVGCICEIRQYVPLPTRHRILIDAKAIGRFRVHRILLDKPFVTALVEEIHDEPPASVAEEATLATLEMRVWQCMQDVQALAVKLYGHLGSLSLNDLYNTEVWRWSLAARGEGVDIDPNDTARREHFSFAMVVPWTI